MRTAKICFGALITCSIVFISCSREEPITSRARNCTEIIIGKSVKELTPLERQIHWTFFDTLAVVAEEVHPDTAFAIYTEFYAKKSEKSRMSNRLAVEQLNAFNKVALNSCLENAIYIPFGDNDFYPALYLQKVEKCREDVLILHNSLGTLDDFREFFSGDPRIKSLFSDEEWLIGPDSTTQIYEWIAKRALDKGDDAPNVNFATVCSHYINLPSDRLYVRGFTWAVGSSPDSLEWARTNVQLRLQLAETALIEDWEPEISGNPWILSNVFGPSIDIINVLAEFDENEAADYIEEINPILDDRVRWQLTLLNYAENGRIDRDFAIESIEKYISALPDSAKKSGFDLMLIDKFEEFVSSE